MIPVLSLVLFLLLPKVKPIVVALAVVIAFRFAGSYRLYRSRLGRRRTRLTSNCRAGCTAKRGTENRAILPAHAVTHCRTCRTADSTAYYSAAIHGIYIHTGGKK